MDTKKRADQQYVELLEDYLNARNNEVFTLVAYGEESETHARAARRQVRAHEAFDVYALEYYDSFCVDVKILYIKVFDVKKLIRWSPKINRLTWRLPKP